MALSIKTEEADRLAPALSVLTGENMTEAVTIALRERLARERARLERTKELPARIASFARRIADAYDTRPVGMAEWDAASGEKPALAPKGE